MTTPRVWVGGLLVCVVSACGLTDTERQTVERWLLCEDCLNGELEAVIALGDRAVPTLKDALHGPDAGRIENVRRQVVASYRDILRVTGPGPLVLTQQAYVQQYTDNYVATYEVRAAVALGRIRIPAARTALLDALRGDSGYRYDVRRALGDALGADTLVIVTGNGQAAPRGDLVPIRPTVVIRDTNALPLRFVFVRFFVDSGGGTVTNSIVQTDNNGRAATGWRLGAVDSINVLRAVSAGRAVKFSATGRP